LATLSARANAFSETENNEKRSAVRAPFALRWHPRRSPARPSRFSHQRMTRTYQTMRAISGIFGQDAAKFRACGFITPVMTGFTMGQRDGIECPVASCRIEILGSVFPILLKGFRVFRNPLATSNHLSGKKRRTCSQSRRRLTHVANRPIP